MRNTVFIQSNHRQLLGALVSAYSLRRNSSSPESFDVRILNSEDFPFLAAREGQEFLRDGRKHLWKYDDLQSFTPLRFMPPELMNYQGRAVVIDPDVFALGDVAELLGRDMEGKAIFCRYREGKGGRPGYFASSVMLLDCARLAHWHCERNFEEMFAFERDYAKWIKLELEPRESIGLLGEEWNDFDTLTEKTKLLHNTKRPTQPWKTGLPIEYGNMAPRTHFGIPTGWAKFARHLIAGGDSPYGRYKKHPDPRQEHLFFSLLREAMDEGVIDRNVVDAEVERGHVRRDALELVKSAKYPGAARVERSGALAG